MANPLAARSETLYDDRVKHCSERPLMRLASPRPRLTSALLACTLVSCAMIPEHQDHDWRAEPHHLSALVAGTLETDEQAPSIGLDYEYRTSEFLGLGVVAEHAFGEIDGSTYLLVADLHITPQFILQTGPGVEFINDEAEVVMRIGCLHEWVFDKWTVSPQLHYDWNSAEDSIVVGVAFGRAF